MNERLNELTKQIQDAIAEIKEMLPVINAGDGPKWFQLMEDDFYENFPSYFRVPFSDEYSEVRATFNGIQFMALSKTMLPVGVDRICVANPERMAM